MNYLIIPAYQPDLNLVKLVRLVHAKSDLHIIVIDDGSDTDKKVIFDKLEGLATVLTHEHNQGKGQALKTAYAYILERGTYGSIVTADADGQHKIWDIFRVVNQSQEHPGTLILGARAFSGKVPLRSAFGNKLTRFLFKQQTGVAVTDTQTGLRAFTTNMIPFMLEIAASKSFPIVEVPIETVYINDNEGSHFRPIRDGLMIYKDMFKFALSSLSSFIVDYLVYAFFLFVMMAVPISLRILLANGIARVTSSIFNYSTNKHLVFKNKDSVAKTGSGYFGLALGLFILDTLLIRLFYTAFGLNLLISKIVVGFLLFLVSWVIQKKVIFKERTAPHHEIL